MCFLLPRPRSSQTDCICSLDICVLLDLLHVFCLPYNEKTCSSMWIFIIKKSVMWIVLLKMKKKSILLHLLCLSNNKNKSGVRLCVLHLSYNEKKVLYYVSCVYQTMKNKSCSIMSLVFVWEKWFVLLWVLCLS